MCKCTCIPIVWEELVLEAEDNIEHNSHSNAVMEVGYFVEQVPILFPDVLGNVQDTYKWKDGTSSTGTRNLFETWCIPALTLNFYRASKLRCLFRGDVYSRSTSYNREEEYLNLYSPVLQPFVRFIIFIIIFIGMHVHGLQNIANICVSVFTVNITMYKS